MRDCPPPPERASRSLRRATPLPRQGPESRDVEARRVREREAGADHATTRLCSASRLVHRSCRQFPLVGYAPRQQGRASAAKSMRRHASPPRFSRTLPRSTHGSCGRSAMCRRSLARGTVVTSRPPTSRLHAVHPGPGLRMSAAARELLPDPVRPTTASLLPAGMSRFTPRSTAGRSMRYRIQ